MRGEIYFHGTEAEKVSGIQREGFKTREGRGTFAKDLGRCLQHLERDATFDELGEQATKENGTILIIAPKEKSIHRRIGASMEETTDEQGKITLTGFPSQWLKRAEYAAFAKDTLQSPEKMKTLEEKYHDSFFQKGKRWQNMAEVNLPPETIIGTVESSPEFASVLSEIKKDLEHSLTQEGAWLERVRDFLKQSLSDGKIHFFQEDALTIEALAESIVNGTIESYIVALVRELYLGIKQKYQDATVVDIKNKKDYSYLKEKVEEKLKKLRGLHFQDRKLERYRSFSLRSLEQLMDESMAS